MGLAVYNSINLDIRLPLCCYKKLLSPAVVPFQNPNAPVGMAQLGLNDLNDVNPVSRPSIFFPKGCHCQPNGFLLQTATGLFSHGTGYVSSKRYLRMSCCIFKFSSSHGHTFLQCWSKQQYHIWQ